MTRCVSNSLHKQQTHKETNTMNSYTIAVRNEFPHGPAYSPVEGIPQNMTLPQAEQLATQARIKGIDCVPFNVASV